MKKKYYLLICLGLLFSSCSQKIVPTSLNNSSLNIPEHQKKVMKSLNASVEKVVNAGGNLKRGKNIIKKINELKLAEFTTT